jgi:hypothetical protein
MPQSMLNAARQEGRLFANRSSADRLIARFSLALRSFLTRLLRTAFPLAVAHPPAKYFRIKCVDDFHFRSKYIAAAHSRDASYAFENKIESRNLLQNQMHGPRSKKRGPMESNTCTPSGVGGGGGVGGSLHITFVRWPERERVALRAILTRVSNIAQSGRRTAGRLLFEAKAHNSVPFTTAIPKEGPAVLEAPGPIFMGGYGPSGVSLRLFVQTQRRCRVSLPHLTRKGGTAACADAWTRQGPRSSFRSRNSERKRNALKAATLVGILLIVVGVIGFAVGGFRYTREKKDVDMGPVQIQHKQTRTVPISPILSTVALIGGIGLVVVGARS